MTENIPASSQLIFLPPPHLRDQLGLPPQDKVDFRAVCFCHQRVVDIGFVCSVCLSSTSLAPYTTNPDTALILTPSQSSAHPNQSAQPANPSSQSHRSSNYGKPSLLRFKNHCGLQRRLRMGSREVGAGRRVLGVR
jgi:hypothetical protein